MVLLPPRGLTPSQKAPEPWYDPLLGQRWPGEASSCQSRTARSAGSHQRSEAITPPRRACVGGGNAVSALTAVLRRDADIQAPGLHRPCCSSVGRSRYPHRPLALCLGTLLSALMAALLETPLYLGAGLRVTQLAQGEHPQAPSDARATAAEEKSPTYWAQVRPPVPCNQGPSAEASEAHEGAAAGGRRKLVQGARR